jgi:hypothetical protein
MPVLEQVGPAGAVVSVQERTRFPSRGRFGMAEYSLVALAAADYDDWGHVVGSTFFAKG